MRFLILGGTGWLGGELAKAALTRGHEVTCLARGTSGTAPSGARLVVSDREAPDSYSAIRDDQWDAVIDLSSEATHARSALADLAPRASHWTYVSSCSVYADTSTTGADEDSPLATALESDDGRKDYAGNKVSSERTASDALEDRLLIVRPGLIGGPGDTSDRTGYWVARSAAAQATPMLVPPTRQNSQVIDVRDLADWIVLQAESRTTGIVDTVGPTITLTEWIAESRRIGGHTGPMVEADCAWLVDQGVAQWAGDDSLAMWIGSPGWEGFTSRSGAKAKQLGLRQRSVSETLRDTLAWERARGLTRDREAGLSPQREQELIDSLGRTSRSPDLRTA